MNNKTTHLVISLILLLPVSIMLENSDGLDRVDSFSGYIGQWIGSIIVSLIFTSIIYGILYIIKKKPSFVSILYKTSYTISILTLLIINLKYL